MACHTGTGPGLERGPRPATRGCTTGLPCPTCRTRTSRSPSPREPAPDATCSALTAGQPFPNELSRECYREQGTYLTRSDDNVPPVLGDWAEGHIHPA